MSKVGTTFIVNPEKRRVLDAVISGAVAPSHALSAEFRRAINHPNEIISRKLTHEERRILTNLGD